MPYSQYPNIGLPGHPLPTAPKSSAPTISHDTPGFGCDSWNVYKHPGTKKIYYYEPHRHIITSDIINDVNLRVRVRIAMQAAQDGIRRWQPDLPDHIKHLEGCDVLVNNGVPRIILAWERQERYDFLSYVPGSHDTRVVMKQTKLDFWATVEMYPCHRDLPKGAESTVVEGLKLQRSSLASAVLDHDSRVMDCWKGYNDLVRQIPPPLQSPEWWRVKHLLAYHVAYLSKIWYGVQKL
ncbi:uncharacterized protein SCHCODRAFT_02244413 [Schizophyllum commune H4-8]|uniref:Uncharacterized protein n=1 Tax=Schizophyllum commune (strain H4-8 / FGSC 9210) TaxID=578458 RepID=D8PMW7_SCHCM|nr:uncharacterized protein SCHCODRAFT_02244413 [Schizophyllum commune H4-8]KAI5893058.1 hypothetical protein SCHCODRAFT_02244413 [Schizophyllum commune H4-8]